jgi:hypothetical protein
MPLTKKTDFTPATAGSYHVTIEAVYSTDNCREMEDTIDQLRQYGFAVVITKRPIAEKFDEACRILQRRSAEGKRIQKMLDRQK